MSDREHFQGYTESLGYWFIGCWQSRVECSHRIIYISLDRKAYCTKTLVNTNTMQLILCARILIQQTLHKPDFQTQDQSVVFSPCSFFSPNTYWSSCLLTGLEAWTSKSCPQQLRRPGWRNLARLDHPVPGCCYSSQLCSLCCLLGYNLMKGKVKSLKM